MASVTSAAKTLGQMAVERTSSVVTGFAKGARGAFLSEMPGITAAYGLAKSLSSQSPQKVDAGSAVVAKETRAGNVINLQMYKEMRATNIGIQNLNRMMLFQTNLEKHRMMFEEERERERQLESKQLIDALKRSGVAGTSGNAQNAGGGLLSGILGNIFGSSIGGLLGGGAALGAGAAAGSKLFGSLFGKGGGGAGGGRGGPPAANDPKFKVGALSRFGLKGVLRFIPYVGTALLAVEALSLLADFFGPSGTSTSSRRSSKVGGTSSGGGGDSRTYLEKVIQAESGGRNVGNKTSSAFGLGQITKGTYEGLVANAAVGSPLRGTSFEDYKKNEQLQIAALEAITAENRARLMRSGLATDDASLYLAHFLGAPVALKVLQANDSLALTTVVPRSFIQANPGVFKNLRTIGDLKKWAATKMGMVGGSAGRSGGAGASAGGGGRGKPPSVTPTIPTGGSGTATDKFLSRAIPVYDATADKNAKTIAKNTQRSAIAGESNNEATHGKARPTKVVDTRTRSQRIFDQANKRFFDRFELTTQRVITRGLTQAAQRAFPEFNRMVSRGTAGGEMYRGRAAGQILNINKKANQIFGKDYGPVFAELGTSYLEAGMSSFGEFLFSDRMGGAREARVLTGQILGNYARGNKKTAREQLIYGLTGIPTGIDSLSRYILGPTGSPMELIRKTSQMAAGGITDVFSSMTGFGGGTGRAVFGGTATGADPWGGVDPFGGLEETQKQTSLLEKIFGATETGNQVAGGVGAGIMKTLGGVGAGILKGISWLGGTLSQLFGMLFTGFGGGGGGFLNTALNLGGKALNFVDDTFFGGAGKSLINYGSKLMGFDPVFANYGASFSSTLQSNILGSVGLAGTAGAYAAVVPGLTTAAAGSQAAMLAAQTGVFGSAGLTATAAAAEVATIGATSTAAAGAAAGAGAGASFAAAVPWIAGALILGSVLFGRKKKAKPRLERAIMVIGNNDITQKFTAINIRYQGDDLAKMTAFLDAFLNVAFTTVKSIQAKTKVDPPMYAISIEFEVDEELGMKFYMPDEKIPSHAPKERRRYGKTNDKSFNGAKVAAQMAKDIREFYSRGKEESLITAITEATNQVTSRSFQELSGGKFAGLSTLDQTVPVKAQEAELARLMKQTFDKEAIVETGEGTNTTLYNPATGNYESPSVVGQLLYDEQGRAIIDVNANKMLDLEDIRRSQGVYNQSKEALDAFIANFNNNNTETQIVSYNEAIKIQLAQMWSEANYDPYGGGG